jgi:hypothetical protein
MVMMWWRRSVGAGLSPIFLVGNAMYMCLVSMCRRVRAIAHAEVSFVGLIVQQASMGPIAMALLVFVGDAGGGAAHVYLRVLVLYMRPLPYVFYFHYFTFCSSHAGLAF